MWWKGSHRTQPSKSASRSNKWQQQQQQQQQRRVYASSVSGKTDVSEGSSDCSLDISNHRCSSIKSLLSLEQSFVSCDDQDTLRLVPPIVCYESESESDDEDGQHKHSSSMLTKVDDIRNDNDTTTVNEIDDDIIPVEAKTKVIVDTGYALDAKTSLDSSSVDISVHECATAKCGSELEEILVDKDAAADRREASLINGKYLLVTSIAPIFSADTCKSPSDEKSKSILPKPTTRPSLAKNADERGGSVRFGVVEIHEHELQLCDLSVPLRGPPVGLGWKRASYQKFQSVDDHLEDANPRSLRELYQTPKQREDTLKELGYSLREIRSATRETGIVRTKRLNSSRFASRNKTGIEVFRKACGKVFCSKPKPATQPTA